MAGSSRMLTVPRYLSVLALDGDVLIGALPPRALRIEDAPEHLPRLLAYLSSPRSRSEAIAESQRLSGLDADAAEAMLDELIAAGALSAGDVETDGRYARHLLYYDLLGADADAAQAMLARSTVGLVGTGGIGSCLATALVAAGVGTVVISDGDDVELSNLTRQTLFDESCVGSPKVEAAAERLRALNADVTIRPVRSAFDGVELLNEHFADCDVVVLSADSPSDVHSWINEAALTHGFAYSNAGYLEAFGVVGPMVVPGESPCYVCIRDEADVRAADGSWPANLNSRHQAPSFGPLNALVASVQANEVIRRLIGQPVQTVGQRLLIDSTTYRVHREDFERDAACPACGTLDAGTPSLDLADVYARDRESASQNALVLDQLTERLVPGGVGRTVLDVGCGSGHDVVRLAATGATVVGVDVSEEMLAVAERRVEEAGLTDRVTLTDAPLDSLEGSFDDILCLNVLDYLEDPAPAIGSLARLSGGEGLVVVSVPHPVKDRGGWRRERIHGGWQQPEFVLDGYFDEGPVEKSQLDAEGEVVIDALPYFHRTTESWVRLLLDAGLSLRALHEPAPDPSRRDALPLLYEKSSRVPYFQVFVLDGGCSPRRSALG